MMAYSYGCAVSSESFYIGLDLENFSGADRSSFVCWIKWLLMIRVLKYSVVKLIHQDLLAFDAFTMFDSVIVFENNTCYVKF
jgi:hypothetical protein